MRNRRKWWTRGVTLVELMVVIALIGILAAFAGPSVARTIERSQAQSAARAVANTLRMARNQAMSRGMAVRVMVEPGTATERGRVHVYRGDMDGTFGAPFQSPLSCRQAGVALWGTTDLTDGDDAVYRSRLDDLAGDTVIREVVPTSGIDLCFSPDGRILQMSPAGLPFAVDASSDPDGVVCDGQNLVMIVADDGATITAPKQCVSKDTNPEISDEREAVNLYRIVVPYNGGIRVEQ